jgi:RND family efflux transporter MFP subunit
MNQENNMCTAWFRRFRLAALVLMALGALSGCEEPVEEQETVRPVRVIRIVPSAAIGDRGLPGRAEPVEEVNLSFDVSGTIAERPVNVGDEVEAGQLLAKLDPRDYQNQLASARAARDRARANFERVKIAAESGAVAKQDLDDARAALDVRQAEVNIAQKALEDTEIRAPRNGSISATYVEAFTAVQAKEPVLRLLDTSSIEMVLQVPENLISYAPLVTDIQVEFDAFPGRTVPARTTEISNEASRTTRTFPVRISMEQPEDFKILPGMAGRARGRLPEGAAGQPQGYQVPAAAVFSSDARSEAQQDFVWVVDTDTNTVSRRAVTTGGLTRFGIAIAEGVSPGDVLVVAGVSSLREGQEVVPMLPEDDA